MKLRFLGVLSEKLRPDSLATIPFGALFKIFLCYFSDVGSIL